MSDEEQAEPTKEEIVAQAKALTDDQVESVTNELLEVTGISVHGGESADSFTKRVCKHAHSKLSDEEWEGLSEEAQCVVNATQIAVAQKGKLPAPLAIQADSEAEEAQEAKSAKKEAKVSKSEKATKPAKSGKPAAAKKAAKPAKSGKPVVAKKAASTKTSVKAGGAKHPAKSAKRPSTNGARNGFELREGSKNAKILALLKRKEGATIAQMMKAAGWTKAKSVRGVISGTFRSKLGLNVTHKQVGDHNVYHIG